jgi:uncharacterized protein YuzE
MKISYDSKYDVLYVQFHDGEVQVVTRNLTDDIAVDLDEAGRLVGLEVLAASKHVDLGALLPVEVTRA